MHVLNTGITRRQDREHGADCSLRLAADADFLEDVVVALAIFDTK